MQLLLPLFNFFARLLSPASSPFTYIPLSLLLSLLSFPFLPPLFLSSSLFLSSCFSLTLLLYSSFLSLFLCPSLILHLSLFLSFSSSPFPLPFSPFFHLSFLSLSLFFFISLTLPFFTSLCLSLSSPLPPSLFFFLSFTLQLLLGESYPFPQSLPL